MNPSNVTMQVPGVYEKIGKRLFDVTVGGLFLVVALPLFAVCAVAVVCSSPGPVLFRQIRIGRFGRPFTLLKFRTMEWGHPGACITASTDSRITRVGQFLRRSKLDELPQLWNVLRGEMSLVGPRPEIPEFVDESDPLQQVVLRLRPGITGKTQLDFSREEELLATVANVKTYYRSVLVPAKLRSDAEYTQKLCIAADFALVVRTLLVPFQHFKTSRRSCARNATHL